MINRNFVVPEKMISARETTRRLNILPRVLKTLGASSEILYIGGSLATGQNYSVHPDSDIDTAFFVTPQKIDHLLGTRLFNEKRLLHYVAGYKRGVAMQFTLDAIIDGVKIECHFHDKDSYLNGLKSEKENVLRFRSSDTPPSVNYGFNFAGDEIETILPTSKVDDWFVAPFPFYIREEKNFYPCRLITSLLGTPIILQGETELMPYINNLWEWMARELKTFTSKQSQFDLEKINIVKSMPGNWKFAKETIQKIHERTTAELKKL